MSPRDSSSRSFSLPRFIVKCVIVIFLITVIIGTAVLLVLPSLLSSDFGRNKATAALEKELKRPVSMDTLSFSWGKGVAVTGLTIKNRDESPLLTLQSFKVTVSWPDLFARRITVQTLTIDGIEVILVRDASGKTNISDLLEPSEKATPEKREPEKLPTELPALFLDAHLKNGSFVFVDQRLDTTTSIRSLNADVSVQSLSEPIELLVDGEIVVDDKKPDQITINGLVHLAPEGRIDPRKTQGKMEMKAGFGSLNAVFDLAKFDAAGEATGADLSCFIDLKKVQQLGAGIFGFPPDFSMKGRVTSKLKARGNLQSQISIEGDTRLTDLALAGGPFKDAPLRQPQINFVQDITLNYAKNVIEISSLDLKGGFLNLAASGSVSDFQKDPACALQLKGNGNLREITKVMGGLLPLPSDVKMNGMMNCTLSANGTQHALHVKGKTAFGNLTINAPFLEGSPLKEESLEITPDFLLNIPKGNVKINSLLLRSALLDGDFEGTLEGDQSIDMKGCLSAALGSLKRQFSALLPPTFPSQGQLSSEITLQGNLEKSLSLKGNHTVEGAIIPLPAGGAKNEPAAPVTIPQLKMVQDLVYALDQDTITLTTLKADAPFFSFDGSGTLVEISKNRVMKCEGDLALDLTEINSLLKGLLPEEVTTSGKGALAFSGEGSLAPTPEPPILSSWSGKGSVSLDTIDYQGFGTIKKLRSTQLLLEKGLLHFALEGLLNNGPTQFQGTLDFNKKRPDMKIMLEGKDVQVSQDLDLLGYVVPILITSSSGKLTGKGDFSVQTSWEGTDWNSEVSRTITGKGNLSLKDGILKSEAVLSVILKSFGKPETIEFEEILTGFRLGEGKLFNDNIQVNGKDLKVGLRGWTALAYNPSKKGNPMDYTVTGDFLRESMGSDGEKVLAILGGGEGIIPVGIGGTVQKPRVSIKMPKAGDLLKGLFAPR